MGSVISELAKIEYDLFVINTYAVAIQAQNGIYYKKNIPLSSFLIQKMLENKGSMGCYQQCYKTDRLRWLCFDFDCKDKEKPDIYGLYEACIRPLTGYLDEHGIEYLTEFSGRRGIHIWIILKKTTTKFIAYQVMDAILSSLDALVGIEESEQWSLDRFPKTGSAKGNVVGSQVKFPLSMHQGGGRSYFFEGYFSRKMDVESDVFFAEQLGILKTYKKQSIEDIIQRLGLEMHNEKGIKYTRYDRVEDAPEDLNEIIECLSGAVVYKEIFERMQAGRALRYDWLVLLGTFVPFDSDGRMLIALFKQFPSYDVAKTIENVNKLRDKYYPAKFSHLYALYNIQMEEAINPDETGVDYLCRKLGGTAIKSAWESFKSAKIEESELNLVLKKERNYLVDNDEVVSVSLKNKLSTMRQAELKRYEDLMERFSPIVPQYICYIRHEEGKDRNLISLSARDRLITTAYALKLYDKMKYRWDSYSYHVSIMDQGNVFYQWYSSWGRYIAQIRAYTELPFMQDSYVFYIDLKQCYPHIDLLNVYRGIEGVLDNEAKQIFRYLADYNDRLMRNLRGGSRIGVPQGPAYARVLAEVYIDCVIKQIVAGESVGHIFRYVDDIVVMCDEEKKAKLLYKSLCNGFLDRNMPINEDKTRYYGKISDMTDDERRQILHSENFNYDLAPGERDEFLVDSDRNERLSYYTMNHPFDMRLLGYLFGNRTFQVAQYYYFYNYGRMIMASRIGRGKSFRQFYSYVLRDSERIRLALKNGWFQEMPVDTINYSNFITTLYFFIQNRRISDSDIRRIVRNYLDEGVSYANMSKDDVEVTQAILEWINMRDRW